jgi:hypothetical protein
MSNPDLVKSRLTEWKAQKLIWNQVRATAERELRYLDHAIEVWESENGPPRT